MPPLEAVIGSDAAWKLTLRDQDDAAITTYTGSAVLVAKCWPGDDRGVTFSPTATWIDADEGTIRLSVAAAQTADLSPGIYNLQLSITASGVTAKQNLPGLRLLGTPGSATAPPSYCTYQDILEVAPWISDQQDLNADQTGFAEQCGKARRWLDRQIIARLRKALRYQRSLGSSSFGTVGIGGYDQGSSYGFSTGIDTSIASSESTLLGYLADDLLLIGDDTLDAGQAREITAYFAVAEILAPQLGSVGETSYQALAKDYRNRAKRMLAGWTARIDVDSDGLIGDGDLELRP